MDYKIEKNIPIPEGHIPHPRNLAASKMEVGDSMIVDKRSNVIATRTYLKRYNRTLTMRKLQDGTFRIWRIS